MLNSKQLLSSHVVANSIMNRGRGLTGMNSYERELKFKITNFLENRVRSSGQAAWLDICCGEGRALMQAAVLLSDTDWGHAVSITGIDLVGLFAPECAPRVQLIEGDAVSYQYDRSFDLITCVHGLHYLGDKLGLLEAAYRNLTPGGLFIGHLDPVNIRMRTNAQPILPAILRKARHNGVNVRFANHILRIKKGGGALSFALAYHGATISETPNYTGITVVDSWYCELADTSSSIS